MKTTKSKIRCGGMLTIWVLALSLIVSVGQTAFAGSLCGWGWNDEGQVDVPAGNDFVAIDAGAYHSLALKSDGSIVGWGHDNGGQASPPAGNDFVAIAAGGNHSLALTTDGSIEGWGSNYYGQVDVPGGNDFVAIAAGGRHSLALKSDGSIVGWGSNTHGQATPPPPEPQTAFPVVNYFVAIAAGYAHGLALKSDGSIVGWGLDAEGQASPPAGNDFVAIAGVYYHNLALKSDGSIVGWGRVGPATPPAGYDFVAIAAGGQHSLALTSDGSIVGWGADNHGQANPPAGNDFVAIAAGWYHSLAIKAAPSGGPGNDWVVSGDDMYSVPTGNVGIGTDSPSEKLEVEGYNPRILIDATASNPELNLRAPGRITWAMYQHASTGDLTFYQAGDKITFQNASGNVGIGTINPQGKLDVNGRIYQRGYLLHADYVFEPGYKLESIDEHSEVMWQNKHLPAIPEAIVDEEGKEIIEVGAHRKGIVEELEKAHIYIEQLHNRVKVLEEKLAKLEAENSAAE